MANDLLAVPGATPERLYLNAKPARGTRSRADCGGSKILSRAQVVALQENELVRYGIPVDQMQRCDLTHSHARSEALFEAIEPVSYTKAPTRLFSALAAVFGQSPSASREKAWPAREDAWRMYLGSVRCPNVRFAH